ncbi:MAG: YncE family protein [Candidatus Planktophila sp.]|jgi:YVTN family beta-propeller protein|nr:YncE family protein [Candidatus Planktophila sp.]
MKFQRVSLLFSVVLILATLSSPVSASTDQTKMVFLDTINGVISPKSVSASNNGLVSAHNMMYHHSVTIYDANSLELKSTVPDSVELSKFGYSKYSGNYKGAPVEGAFSPDGKYLYFTNYAMYGKGFTKEGHDTCSPASGYDTSFLSRINLENNKIDAVYPVGSVPKVVKVTPDNKYILVSNWCSYTVTIISVETQKTVKSIKIGRYPRGISVSADSKFAYVAEMGGSRIHRIALEDFSVSYIPIGSNPRAIELSPDNSKLYVTLNISGKVIAWDLEANKAIKTVATGKSARSLAISSDGSSLFVVNFRSGTLSKVRTSDMKVIQNIKVCTEPIGVTYDSETSRTWVACYGGSIKVFANQ